MDWEKLQRIDVRILYVIILLYMTIPMLKQFGLPVAISENSRKVYQVIEDLPDGSVIWGLTTPARETLLNLTR